MWRARLIARASSRCFLAETAVIRDWDDLAALGNESLQQANVLVIDPRSVLAREGAGLAAAEKCSSHSILHPRRGRPLTTLAAVSAAIAPVAAALAAHHRRRALLMLVHADRHEADHVLVDVGLALELGNAAGGASTSSIT
jgi:hypothetical protein